ncbi:hypothetical protein FYJ72_01920 [Prevotella copri]|uniref:Minor fimbrium subunit Mfa1 C-terminal domain-containing protein n=1 Tax=Segatella copri TaxID=165179 RepID=A0A6I2TVM0_9BACT|nr:Mfa1 family fimbria major subunit [Segatella copri]MST76473.1 hypothetical protein [Segatella copri]
MKKITMLSSVLASALMLTVASCSSEDVAGDDAQIGKGTTSFLAVNIENVGSAPASRSYEQGDGTYENGTQAESKINKVRFYFFNGDGTPYLLVKKDPSQAESVNYLDKYVEQHDNNDQTVETKTDAVLVIEGNTKTVPASVIAVINPDVLEKTTLHNGKSMTISELRTSATGSKFYDTTNGFVMSNSVYESAGQDICSTPVANNVFSTSDKALNNPVDIYVERVNAKVNAKIDKNYIRTGETENAWSQNAEGKYQIKVGSIDVTTYEENTNSTPTTHEYPVYAVVQGWQVADANGKAEVCKQIKTSWFAGELGINPWTTSDYHRSFWSESVPFNSGAVTGANRPVNPSFNGIKMPLSDDFAATPVYTLPNTPDAVVQNPKTSDNDLTKLIVAAKLVYKDADNSYKTAQVCQYRGLTYLGEDAVKKQIVGGFKQYLKITATGGYQSIEASDITFKTVPGSSVVKDYEVVATLASNVGELYVKDGETYKTVSKDDVNAALAKEEAQVRSTDGATYYYTPIKHLGDAGKLGEYGIVRNHSYQVTIQNIKGFGTPVYNPDQKIDPMIPSDENTYLAASIKVLSWRVVSSTVDLDQTK